MEKKKNYRFTGKEGAFLKEAVLKKWIQRHQDFSQVRAHFFGKEIIQKILNQPGCVGIRIHYAINDDGERQLILLGADEKGNNIWPASGGKGKLADGGGGGVDNSYPCPPYC